IPNATLTLYDDQYKMVSKVQSDANGHYAFAVDCGKLYHVRAEKPEYSTDEKPIQIAAETGMTTLSLELEKSQQPVTVGTDLANVLEIKLIYFDLDKWDIREDAAVELQKIVEVLKQHPTMKIDIRSHTDSRQTHR